MLKQRKRVTNRNVCSSHPQPVAFQEIVIFVAAIFHTKPCHFLLRTNAALRLAQTPLEGPSEISKFLLTMP
jgi:hypothetical protein